MTRRHWSSPPDSIDLDGDWLTFDTRGTPMDMEWSLSAADLCHPEKGRVAREFIERGFGVEVLREVMALIGTGASRAEVPPLAEAAAPQAAAPSVAAQATAPPEPVAQATARPERVAPQATAAPEPVAPAPRATAASEPEAQVPPATAPPEAVAPAPQATAPPPAHLGIALMSDLLIAAGLPTHGFVVTATTDYAQIDGAELPIERWQMAGAWGEKGAGIEASTEAETAYWNPHTPARTSLSVRILDRRAGLRMISLSAEEPYSEWSLRELGDPMVPREWVVAWLTRNNARLR